MSQPERGVQFTVHARTDGERGALVVAGDDPRRIAAARDALVDSGSDRKIESDGGGPSSGPAELDERPQRSLEDFEGVLRRRDVDRVALAFERADRNRFFGAVRACREHDVTAIVPPDRTDPVLVADDADGWAEVQFHPWSRSQRLRKRAFDVAFALVGLALLAPLLALIALAIKLDSSGPVLYTQERTGYLGETFQARKFRTMYPESENPVPEDDRHNDRITRVGRILRKTHADEIPQLWSILNGDMSAVGPRATWVAEEDILARDVSGWQRRYFVKPGLTGLAQINNVTSTKPRAKLRYDIEYVRGYSVALDAWIVCRQIALVVTDLLALLERRFS